jgi:hypothetical protein
MTAILLILILIALQFNIQSLKGVMAAELVSASWKEFYKIALNLAIIFYLYGQFRL